MPFNPLDSALVIMFSILSGRPASYCPSPPKLAIFPMPPCATGGGNPELPSPFSSLPPSFLHHGFRSAWSNPGSVKTHIAFSSGSGVAWDAVALCFSKVQ